MGNKRNRKRRSIRKNTDPAQIIIEKSNEKQMEKTRLEMSATDKSCKDIIEKTSLKTANTKTEKRNKDKIKETKLKRTTCDEERELQIKDASLEMTTCDAEESKLQIKETRLEMTTWDAEESKPDKEKSRLEVTIFRTEKSNASKMKDKLNIYTNRNGEDKAEESRMEMIQCNSEESKRQIEEARLEITKVEESTQMETRLKITTCDVKESKLEIEGTRLEMTTEQSYSEKIENKEESRIERTTCSEEESKRPIEDERLETTWDEESKSLIEKTKLEINSSTENSYKNQMEDILDIYTSYTKKSEAKIEEIRSEMNACYAKKSDHQMNDARLKLSTYDVKERKLQMEETRFEMTTSCTAESNENPMKDKRLDIYVNYGEKSEDKVEKINMEMPICDEEESKQIEAMRLEMTICDEKESKQIEATRLKMATSFTMESNEDQIKESRLDKCIPYRKKSKVKEARIEMTRYDAEESKRKVEDIELEMTTSRTEKNHDQIEPRLEMITTVQLKCENGVKTWLNSTNYTEKSEDKETTLKTTITTDASHLIPFSEKVENFLTEDTKHENKYFYNLKLDKTCANENIELTSTNKISVEEILDVHSEIALQCNETLNIGTLIPMKNSDLIENYGMLQSKNIINNVLNYNMPFIKRLSERELKIFQYGKLSASFGRQRNNHRARNPLDFLVNFLLKLENFSMLTKFFSCKFLAGLNLEFILHRIYFSDKASGFHMSTLKKEKFSLNCWEFISDSMKKIEYKNYFNYSSDDEIKRKDSTEFKFNFENFDSKYEHSFCIYGKMPALEINLTTDLESSSKKCIDYLDYKRDYEIKHEADMTELKLSNVEGFINVYGEIPFIEIDSFTDSEESSNKSIDFFYHRSDNEINHDNNLTEFKLNNVENFNRICEEKSFSFYGRVPTIEITLPSDSELSSNKSIDFLDYKSDDEIIRDNDLTELKLNNVENFNPIYEEKFRIYEKVPTIEITLPTDSELSSKSIDSFDYRSDNEINRYDFTEFKFNNVENFNWIYEEKSFQIYGEVPTIEITLPTDSELSSNKSIDSFDYRGDDEIEHYDDLTEFKFNSENFNSKKKINSFDIYRDLPLKISVVTNSEVPSNKSIEYLQRNCEASENCDIDYVSDIKDGYCQAVTCTGNEKIENFLISDNDMYPFIGCPIVEASNEFLKSNSLVCDFSKTETEVLLNYDKFPVNCTNAENESLNSSISLTSKSSISKKNSSLSEFIDSQILNPASKSSAVITKLNSFKTSSFVTRQESIPNECEDFFGIYSVSPNIYPCNDVPQHLSNEISDHCTISPSNEDVCDGVRIRQINISSINQKLNSNYSSNKSSDFEEMHTSNFFSDLNEIPLYNYKSVFNDKLTTKYKESGNDSPDFKDCADEKSSNLSLDNVKNLDPPVHSCLSSSIEPYIYFDFNRTIDPNIYDGSTNTMDINNAYPYIFNRTVNSKVHPFGFTNTIDPNALESRFNETIDPKVLASFHSSMDTNVYFNGNINPNPSRLGLDLSPSEFKNAMDMKTYTRANETSTFKIPQTKEMTYPSFNETFVSIAYLDKSLNSRNCSCSDPMFVQNTRPDLITLPVVPCSLNKTLATKSSIFEGTKATDKVHDFDKNRTSFCSTFDQRLNLNSSESDRISLKNSYALNMSLTKNSCSVLEKPNLNDPGLEGTVNYLNIYNSLVGNGNEQCPFDFIRNSNSEDSSIVDNKLSERDFAFRSYAISKDDHIQKKNIPSNFKSFSEVSKITNSGTTNLHTSTFKMPDLPINSFLSNRKNAFTCEMNNNECNSEFTFEDGKALNILPSFKAQNLCEGCSQYDLKFMENLLYTKNSCRKNCCTENLASLDAFPYQDTKLQTEKDHPVDYQSTAYTTSITDNLKNKENLSSFNEKFYQSRIESKLSDFENISKLPPFRSVVNDAQDVSISNKTLKYIPNAKFSPSKLPYTEFFPRSCTVIPNVHLSTEINQPMKEELSFQHEAFGTLPMYNFKSKCILNAEADVYSPTYFVESSSNCKEYTPCLNRDCSHLSTRVFAEQNVLNTKTLFTNISLNRSSKNLDLNMPNIYPMSGNYHSASFNEISNNSHLFNNSHDRNSFLNRDYYRNHSDIHRKKSIEKNIANSNLYNTHSTTHHLNSTLNRNPRSYLNREENKYIPNKRHFSVTRSDPFCGPRTPLDFSRMHNRNNGSGTSTYTMYRPRVPNYPHVPHMNRVPIPFSRLPNRFQAPINLRAPYRPRVPTNIPPNNYRHYPAKRGFVPLRRGNSSAFIPTRRYQDVAY